MFDLIDGSKRRILAAVFTLVTMGAAFGLISPEQAQWVNIGLSALFGVAQTDAMLGYPSRGPLESRATYPAKVPPKLDPM